MRLMKVTVRWLDATSQDETCKIEELNDFKPIPCMTAGWLVKDEPDYVVVARDLFGDEQDHPSGCIAIPRGCIVYILNHDT